MNVHLYYVSTVIARLAASVAVRSDTAVSSRMREQLRDDRHLRDLACVQPPALANSSMEMT